MANYTFNNMNEEMEKSKGVIWTDEKSNETLIEKIEWLGWRIASEISDADNGSYFNDINKNLSEINLTLQEINGSLIKIAEKE